MKWRKSTRSQSGAGQCVEVAALGERVMVRDSKDPEGAVLACPRGAWEGFVSGLSR